MKSRINMSLCVAGLILVAEGCSGSVGGAKSGNSDNGGRGPAGNGGSGPQVKPPTPAPGGSERPDQLTSFFDPPANKDRPLARMTRDQLTAIAQDLFNVTLSAQDLASLPPVRAVDTTIDPSQYVEGVWTYAGLVATRAFSTPGTLVDYCTKKAVADLACARAMINEFAPLLLQRKPSNEEADAFAAHFTKADGLDVQERLQTVLRALLMAPGFLFPTEAAPSAPVADHFALSRLTLALWNSLPDAAAVSKLAADAASGKASVVDALLTDPRSERLYTRLGTRLVDLSRLGDLARAPSYTAAFSKDVQSALRQELRLTLAAALADNAPDSFSQLLTTPKVMVNKLTAPLYGLSATSDKFSTMDSMAAEQRSGLLTSAPVLSILAHSEEGSVVLRGVFVLQRLLCVPPPPPPPNVPPLDAAGSTASASQRQRLDLHRQPSCKACHSAIDGVGFGLERYDAIGRFVTMDHGQPLTGQGVFPQTLDGPEKPFTGAKELGQMLAGSAQARECFVSQLHAALTDRDSNAAERTALDAARSKFVSSGNVHQLVTDLMTNTSTNVRF